MTQATTTLTRAGAMDVLDDHSDALGARLAMLMRPLIDEDLSVVFYDLTTVEIAGEAVVAEDVCAHGRSKSGLVARQFMLSLVPTAEGLPIAHEVHPGNIAEARTLLPMISSLLQRYPVKRVVLVLAVPAARYGDFADALRASASAQPADKPWVAETTWESSCRSQSKASSPTVVTRRLVIAHDPEAPQRRTDARNKAIQALLALGEQWGGKLDAQDAGARRRGRPLWNSGAKARFYHAVKDANLAHLIKVDLRSDTFSFTIDEDKQRYLELLDGKLLLVTNTDVPPAEVVRRYKSLADIERGCRVLKSDIEIGPVYHRLPRRIRAHALVCFMALILYRVMRMRLKAHDRDESPTRLLQQLQRIYQQTVRTADGHTLHGLTDMTAAQKSLFSVLQLPLPTPSQLAPPSS